MDQKRKNRTSRIHTIPDPARANTLQVGFPYLRRKTLPMGSSPLSDMTGNHSKGAPVIYGGTIRSGRKNDDFTNIFKNWLGGSRIINTTLFDFNLGKFIDSISKAVSVTPRNGRGYVEINSEAGKRYRAYVMLDGEAGVEVQKDEVDQGKSIILEIGGQFWFVYPEKEKK